MKSLWKRASLLVIASFALASAPAKAQTAFISATDIGAGMFRYSILLDSTGLPEPIQGMILFNSSIVFGLNEASVISAPLGWDFFQPAPPVADSLPYFSLDSASDIPMNAFLGGFTFQSSVNPGTLNLNNIQIDVVGSNTAVETPATVAVAPEPSTLALLSSAVLSILLCVRRRRRATSSIS